MKRRAEECAGHTLSGACPITYVRNARAAVGLPFPESRLSSFSFPSQAARYAPRGAPVLVHKRNYRAVHNLRTPACLPTRRMGHNGTRVVPPFPPNNATARLRNPRQGGFRRGRSEFAISSSDRSLPAREAEDRAHVLLRDQEEWPSGKMNSFLSEIADIQHETPCCVSKYVQLSFEIRCLFYYTIMVLNKILSKLFLQSQKY